MRAYIVLLALLVTPLARAASQTGSGMPGNSSCDNGNGDANRSDSGTVHAHQGLCVPQPPPPPPPPPTPTCGQMPAPTGTAAFQGQVFQDVAPAFAGLPGWCVDISGPVSGTALTDVTGHYTFSGLPAGTYTLCEEIQTGWHQTFPPSGAICPGGFGYTFTIMNGATSQFNDFGNVTP